MSNNYVELNVSDGTKMQAYVTMPDDVASEKPAIILFQEAFGVNHHIQSLSDRFVREGYVVIAPELFHRSAEKGQTFEYTNFPAVMPHIQALTTEGLEADIKASWDWLQNCEKVQKENIFCIGYCMGGRTSFLANTILPFKGAVSYYGGRIVPDLIKRADDLHTDMLFFWGDKDKSISNDQIEEITAALKKSRKRIH